MEPEDFQTQTLNPYSLFSVENPTQSKSLLFFQTPGNSAHRELGTMCSLVKNVLNFIILNYMNGFKAIKFGRKLDLIL